MCKHQWNTCFCTPLGCTVHHLLRTAQPRRCTGMETVFTLAHVGWWNENVTLIDSHKVMSRRPFCLSRRQCPENVGCFLEKELFVLIIITVLYAEELTQVPIIHKDRPLDVILILFHIIARYIRVNMM